MIFESDEEKYELSSHMTDTYFKCQDGLICRSVLHTEFVAFRESVIRKGEVEKSVNQLILAADTFPDWSTENLLECLKEAIKSVNRAEVAPNDDDCDRDNYYAEYHSARLRIKELEKEVEELKVKLHKLESGNGDS